MENEKIEGLKESLKNLLVEGDLPAADAVRAVAHYLLDGVEYAPEPEKKKILEACQYLSRAVQVIEGQK